MNRSSCKRRSVGADGHYKKPSLTNTDGLDTVKQKLKEGDTSPAAPTFFSRTLHGSLRRKKGTFETALILSHEY